MRNCINLVLFRPVYAFFIFMCIVSFFTNCTPPKIEKVSFHDLVFLQEIHDDRGIYVADSLAFFGHESLAAAHYMQLIKQNKLHGQQLDYVKAQLLSIVKDSVQSKALYDGLMAIDSSVNHFSIHLGMTSFELKTRKKISFIDPLKNILHADVPDYYKGQAAYLTARYYEEKKNDLDSAWHYIMIAKSAFERTKVISPAYQECLETITSFCTYKRKNLLAIRHANVLFEFDRYLPKCDSLDMAKAYANRAYMMFREGDITGTELDIKMGLSYCNSEQQPETYQNLMKSYLVIYMIQGKDSLWHDIANKINQNIASVGKDYIEMNRWYGQYYTQKKQYTKAIPFLKLALDMEIKNGNVHSARHSMLCFSLSQCYENIGNYAEALSYMAINEGLKNFDANSMLTHISLGKRYPFVAGLQCANIYFSQFNFTNQLASLIQAKAYLDVLDEKMFGQFKVAEENAILQFYLESGQDFFHLGMDVHYELWKKTGDQIHLETFINYSDKNKNSLMYRDIQMAQQQAALPSDIVQKEFNLRAAIKTEKTKGLQSNHHFNSLMDEYTALEETIEKKHKPFITEGLIKESITLNQTQQEIADVETCILIVDETPRHWYYTLLTKNNIIVERKDLSMTKIIDFDTLIHKLQAKQVDQNIKNQLLPNTVTSALTKKIMFIPDGIYHRFPLSALLNDNNYIVKHLPSTRLYKKFSKNERIDKGVALFAFSDKETIKSSYRTRLTELPGTYKEVNRLSKTYPDAKIFAGKQATKSNFIKAYQDSNIQYIHLALHGLANSIEKDDVKLYFRTSSGGLDSLYGYELMKYKSACKKVVLSACQSGIGTYEKGEGLFSLPRYFMINGATNVVFLHQDMED